MPATGTVRVLAPPDRASRELAALEPRVRVDHFPAVGVPVGPLDDVEVLITPWGRADDMAAVIARSPRLRLVQSLSVGVEWLPPLPEGVILCNARGVHDAAVSEWVVGAILAHLKRFPDCVEARRRETFPSLGPDDLAGKVVLIVGYGSIGRALERRLEPFEARVLRVARRSRHGVAGRDELPALVPRADIVVLLVPLTAETRGLFGAALVDALKPGAIVVNAARGAVLDQEALLAALRARRVRAALDVTDPEPLPAGHALWSAPDVLLSPHVAGVTPALLPRAYRFVRRQLERYLAGEPLRNVVSADEDRTR